jgi:hypothetical protein
MNTWIKKFHTEAIVHTAVKIISLHEEKVFDKIQHHCIRKTLTKLGIGRMYHQTIKAIYGKCTTNIIVNSEKLKAFL